MFNSVKLDNNKKDANWKSTRVSPEKIKPCNTNLAPVMTNLASGKLSLKYNNSALVPKKTCKLLPFYKGKFVHY